MPICRLEPTASVESTQRSAWRHWGIVRAELYRSTCLSYLDGNLRHVPNARVSNSGSTRWSAHGPLAPCPRNGGRPVTPGGNGPCALPGSAPPPPPAIIHDEGARAVMMRGPAPPTPRRSRGAPSVLRPGRCGGAFKWRPRPPAREVTVEDAQIAPRRPKRGLGPAKCRAGESKGADSPDGRAQWSLSRFWLDLEAAPGKHKRIKAAVVAKCANLANDRVMIGDGTTASSCYTCSRSVGNPHKWVSIDSL